MQEWFFLENPNCEVIRRKFAKKPWTKELASESTPSAESEIMKQCNFSVLAENVKEGACVCITGDVASLGSWHHDSVVPLKKDPDLNIWNLELDLPTEDIAFRYCICMLSDNSINNYVLLYEAHIHPRLLKADATLVNDVFGFNNGNENVNKGWLITHSLIQFKFWNSPIKLKTRYDGKLINIKVTPVKLSFSTEKITIDDSSLSTDTSDAAQKQSDGFVEVASFNNSDCKLIYQEQFGKLFNENDDLLIFNVVVPKVTDLAYLIDFYTYSDKAGADSPPYHIGYTYVLPNMIKGSAGNLELPITCSVKHRPLGAVKVDYLLVLPMTQLCDLQVSYAKHWDPTWTGLEVGHRGLGASFKTKEGNSVRENTIASLKQAAASGADLLEFDVQLSKDMIPVIYHDYHVCISMKRKKEVNSNEMFELPVKELSLDQLQKLKVYHLVEGRNNESRFDDEHLEEHQPFPTLEELFKVIDPHVGFNVELKWTMELEDGTFELNNPFDMNTYVDKVLEVVLKNAGDRRIVISCFNPDICTLARNKQNKYPVMFLTVGVSQRYRPYKDLRCLNIPAAVRHAVSSDLLGIVAHTEDLLRDPSQVQLAKDAGLVLFCWGDDNNDRATIARLKQMGLHAVIYDKLDQFTTKPFPESVFMIEARDSQAELMRMAKEAPSSRTTTTSSCSVAEPRPFLDLRKLERNNLVSTATSLESVLTTRSLKRPGEESCTGDALSDRLQCPNTTKGHENNLKQPKSPRQSQECN